VDIAGNRFLVIGGAGFIGSHLVDQLLSAGAEHVRIYDNFSRGSRDNLHQALDNHRTEIFSDGGDIVHSDTLHHAMQDMNGVFHLAALWLLQCHKFPRSAFDVNIAGTMNVIESVIKSDVKRLIFSSSASVYGTAESEPMHENHPLNCTDFYGASKVCGEMLLRALLNQDAQHNTGLEYVGLRYMNVYGTRQYDKGPYTGVITSMLNAMDANEQPVIYGDGKQSYDFVDVRDCARANVLAMQADVSDKFYNIGTGEKRSIIDIAELLCTMHPNKISARFESSKRSFVQNRIGDTEQSLKDLGFYSTIDLVDGLCDLIKWRTTKQN
jgi:nucleoside-diphosphate-sugar epimerase